jgi:serine/threonine protein kinase
MPLRRAPIATTSRLRCGAPSSALQHPRRPSTVLRKVFVPSQVYKAIDQTTGQVVAIKQVSLERIGEDAVGSLLLEIDLLKNLNHRNIVTYLGSYRTPAALCIILEYVENGSIATLLKPSKFGAFPESLVAVYISQVGSFVGRERVVWTWWAAHPGGGNALAFKQPT